MESTSPSMTYVQCYLVYLITSGAELPELAANRCLTSTSEKVYKGAITDDQVD